MPEIPARSRRITASLWLPLSREQVPVQPWLHRRNIPQKSKLAFCASCMDKDVISLHIQLDAWYESPPTDSREL